MRTLYIIDGYAQFFRAYHAIRTPMTSPVTGEPTNMSFGFVGMLLKLLRGEGQMAGPPDYVAVALDVSGDRGTFRSEIYEDYKATRPPPPEDLSVQVDRCLALLESIGVPIIGAEGYEADDVIASLCERLCEADPDLRIRIISKDKDLKQILRAGRVELYDVHTDKLYTESTLREETGLDPQHVVDMLALMGDTVDNVPGVPGVGEKTAAKLIAEHGSLDALLAAADTIKGKRGENLRAAAELLTTSRELVTLKRDLEAPLELEAAARAKLRLAELEPILRELGFNRYQDDVRALLAGAGEGQAPAGGRGAPATAPDGFADGLFAPPAPPEETTRGEYEAVTSKEQLHALVKALRSAGVFAIDTETTDLSPMKAELCGLSFAIEPGHGWYVPLRCPEAESCLAIDEVLDALRPLLEDAAAPKYGHNLKYDLLVLRRAGVELRGLEHPESCDTMVASYLIDASRSSHAMDALALSLLNYSTIQIKDLIGTGKNQKCFDEVPLDRATQYAAEDADVTLRLAHAMLPQLEAMDLMDLFTRLEMPLVAVLAELEWNGVLVDPNELDRQRERLAQQITELREKIKEEALERCGRAFDPDSPRQLAAILFNKPDHEEAGLGIRPLKRGKTGPSTDAEVLEKLAQDPLIESCIPELILEYRQLTKLVNTYLVSLKEAINPETKRIHASFNQTVAATGRLSSSDPNLQNIPIRTDVGREIRRAFIAAPGRVLISADYSQIELRLLAHLSQDPALMEAFHAGADIHSAVAAQVHGVALEAVTSQQRSGAKMVNFGIVYGITPFGLARRLGIDKSEAAQIIDDYKCRFSGITTFLEECIAQARRYGYVETMMKRRRPIRDIDARTPARKSLAERMAINSVVQGSAADLIKLAMVDLYERLSEHAERRDQPELPGVQMLVQIHDELVFEANESNADDARRLIVERMEHAMDLSVPLVVESHISRSWYEGK